METKKTILRSDHVMLILFTHYIGTTDVLGELNTAPPLSLDASMFQEPLVVLQ